MKKAVKDLISPVSIGKFYNSQYKKTLKNSKFLKSVLKIRFTLHIHTHIHTYHRKIPNVCVHATHALVYVTEKIENCMIKATYFTQGDRDMIHSLIIYE